jgi:prepilin-type N-terminal cleavage/methylation domain-containing protein
MNFHELLRQIPSLHLMDRERDTGTGEAMRTAKTAKQSWPRGQRGVTLIELMIALVLTAVIGGALYQGLVSQSKTFIQQDQVSEAMQHCRTATEQILRELRMAGYSMAYIVGAPDNTVNDQGIVVGTTTVINATSVTTNNDANRGTTDSLVIRRGDAVPWSIRMYKVQHLGRWIKVRLDQKIHVREGDPDYVLLMNKDKTDFWSTRVTARGVDDEDATKKMIWVEDYTGSIASDTDGDPNNGLTGKATTDGFYTDGLCVKFKEIAFYIDTSSGIPTLMKAINGYSSQIVARYIEDLQIAYQDSAGTWYRGGSGTTQSDPPVINDIRNVRISVLARASTASPRSNYSHAALEDGNRHPATGADGFVRRSLTSQVRARNFGVD